MSTDSQRGSTGAIPDGLVNKSTHSASEVGECIEQEKSAVSELGVPADIVPASMQATLLMSKQVLSCRNLAFAGLSERFFRDIACINLSTDVAENLQYKIAQNTDYHRTSHSCVANEWRHGE